MRHCSTLATVGIAICTVLLWWVDPMSAAEDQATGAIEEQATVTADETPSNPRMNLALKTAGGTQLWTDHLYRDGYRIQQNCLTGHWRLLNPQDVRQGWGSREACENLLDRLRPADAATTAPKHVVVLLHGLMRTRHCMAPLEQSLREAGYPEVIRFSYASSRGSISDHASALREVLENLPESTQLSFVGHSMGNIVVRHLIGDLQRDGDPAGILPRCRAMVMLGPPNQGAAIARRLAPTGLYGIITGPGGMELGPQWDEFVAKLSTPPFSFIIIAGDVRLPNPLVEGSSDFIVSVEEAFLEGAESFHTVPVLHSFLMNDPQTVKLTVDFLGSHGASATPHAFSDPC